MAGILDLIEQRRRSNMSSVAEQPTAEDVAVTKPRLTPEQTQLEQGSAFGQSLEGGYEQTKGLVKNAIAAAADAVQQPAFGKSMRTSAQGNEAEAASLFRASEAPMSLKDTSLDTLPAFLAQGVTRNAPQLGAMVAGRGVLGRAGVPATAVAMNVGDVYGEGNNEIDALVKSGQATPEREAQLRQQVLEKSGLAGTLMGALDTIGFTAMFPGMMKGAAASAVARSLPSAVRSAIIREGVTEATQEYIGLVANKLALEKPDEFGLTEQDVFRLADAGALGAASGGTFGLPGNVLANAGRGVDAAIDAGAGLLNRAREAVPTIGAAAPTAGTADVSVGTRAGQFVRAMSEGNLQIKVQDLGDQLLAVPGVQEAIQQGKDFLAEVRPPARAVQFWNENEAVARTGFEQFMQAYGDAAQTGNIEEIFGRYKQALAGVAQSTPNMPKLDPATAGQKLGEAVAGFNEWLGRNEPVARSVIGAAVNTVREVAPIIGEAVGDQASMAASAARTVTQGATELIKKYGDPLVQQSKDAWRGMADGLRAETGPDENPASAEQADAAAEWLRNAVGDGPAGTTKRSVVMTPDARIAAATIRGFAPNMSKQAVDQLARAMEPLLRDRARMDAFMSQPDVVREISNTFNVRPDQLLAQVFLDLRAYGQDTETEALGYMGLPPAEEQVIEAPPQETEEGAVDEFNDTGVTVQDQAVIADPQEQQRETFKKMLLTPQQREKSAQPKGTQWVLLNKTVKDPATGAVLEQGTTQHRVNMMNIARSQAGARPATGQSTVERNDQNFAEGMGQLFAPWTDTDEQGRTIEYQAQPARQNTQDNVVTAVPLENLEGWLRDESVIGYDQGEPRTFADMKQGQEPFDRVGSALQRLALADMKIDEADSPRSRQFWRNKREHELRKIGKVAIEPALSLRDMDEEEVRALIDGAVELVQRAEAPAQVDEAWDELQLDPNPEALAAFRTALEGDLMTRLRALPTEVLDVAGPLLTRKLNEVVVDRYETNRAPEIIPGAQDADAFGDPQGEVVTEDLAGQFIDYARPERKSVIASRREAAPEVAASAKKSQAGPSGPAVDLTTPEGQDVARAEIEKIAGRVDIRFGTENSYDWQGHVITLAAAKSAALSTAHHEALHGIFKSIAPDDKATLYRGLNTAHVRGQLKRLLVDSPEAYADATRDAEELAAYAFQFWKAGKLNVGPDTANWLSKLMKLIEDVWNWVKDQPSAEALMQRVADGYYANGGPSPVELALAKQSRGAARQVMSSVARGTLAVYDKLLSAMDDRLRDTGVGELTELAREFYVQVGESTERRGLAQEIPAKTAKWMNELGRAIGKDANVAMQALQAMANGDNSSPKAKELRKFLDDVHGYLQKAGVDIGYVKDYLPMQWSGDKIRENHAAFVAMLQKYDAQIKALNPNLTAEAIAEMMEHRNLKNAIPTGNIYDEVGVPTAHHVEDRVFKFLTNEDRAPFIEDNLIGTMGQYVKQVVKHAEWVRRFGNESQKFEALKTAAEARGATPEQLALVDDYKDAVFGAKYNKMDPTLRKVLGGVQVYQNLRVLWLALFSSVADPMAIGVRSGEFKETWGAFKAGVKGLAGLAPSELKTLSEDIGAINELGAIDSLTTLYGGFEVEGNLKKANDLLFKLNGLDGLTRALRVYAAGAGLRFIARADERALSELGLTQADLTTLPDGTLDVRGNPKLQTALNRFIDESVLRPNAAERPNWANNPLFSLLFHLKQFLFSFHKVVGKKVLHELEHGNPAPVLSAAAFVPLLAASGYVKDLIQFAGEIPADRGFLHYAGVGVNRSGFLGPSVLPADFVSDIRDGRSGIGAIGGPAASQALEAVQAVGNPEAFGNWLEEALPGSSVYKRW